VSRPEGPPGLRARVARGGAGRVFKERGLSAGGLKARRNNRPIFSKVEMKLFDAHIKRFNIDLAWSVLLRVRVRRVRLPTNGRIAGRV